MAQDLRSARNGGGGRIAHSSCGRDCGVCLIGVEELAAEPAVLVQVTTGHLEPHCFAHVAGPDRVEPGDGDEPLDRRGGVVVVARADMRITTSSTVVTAPRAESSVTVM